LEKLIKRSGRLEVKMALEIATRVTAGLTQKLIRSSEAFTLKNGRVNLRFTTIVIL